MSERYVVRLQGCDGSTFSVVELEPFEAKIVERVFESTNQPARECQPKASIQLEWQVPDWIANE